MSAWAIGLTKCLSAGQGPTGRGYRWWCTLMKPASFINPSSIGPGQGSMPASRVALMKPEFIFITAQSLGKELSGEVQLRSRSIISVYPPGLVNLS